LDSVNGEYAFGLSDGLLYAAPLAGGPQRQLADQAAQTADLSFVSADGRQVVYLARRKEQAASGGMTLYVATLAALQP
jgi:hypothetical protein